MANTDLQYDRNTINLVFELKRSLPLDQQANFKLSSPDLMHMVEEIYHADLSQKSKELAGQLLDMAGIAVKNESKGFFAALKPGNNKAQTSSGATNQSKTKSKTKTVKMYRGQIVE